MADTRPENDREATERIVLRLVTPRTADEPERWEVLGTTWSASKTKAIDYFAKDQPGKYRAPPLRSWKGGKEISIPDKPAPVSKLFE